MLITSKNQQLHTNDIVHFDDLSIGFSSAMNLYIVSPVELTALNCKVLQGDAFKLYRIVDGTVDVIDTLVLTDVVGQQISGQWVYKINIFCSSDEAGLFEDQLQIDWTADTSESITIRTQATIIELDQKLVVNLQNFKRFLTEEYMQAMHDTEYNAKSIDFKIYNQKIREYLLNLLNIDAMLGSYKSLRSVLKFFGYGDLLDIREYWHDKESNRYQLSSIQDQVLSKIERGLVGYKKSNQMALVYQINQEQGVDSDGLPIYINVLDETDQILFKLWTLERILERDFLFMGSHIVDIIGEFQSVVGLEFNAVLNDVMIYDTNISEDLNAKLSIEIVNDSIQDDAEVAEVTKVCYVQRHNVLLHEAFAFLPGEPLLDVAGKTTNFQTDEIFDVDARLDMSAESTNDYDILTNWYAGDFGLIELKLNLDINKYQSFKYVLLDINGNQIFESKQKNVQQFGSGVFRCGIKSIGTYSILIYALDHYGGYSVASVDHQIDVRTKSHDFFVASYKSGGFNQDINLWTTFKDTTGETTLPVVNDISETLDINTWDQELNSPALSIQHMYESDFDQISTWTNLNQLNSIPLKDMAGMPLHVHGYLYSIFVYDIIGNQETGNRKISISLFEGKPPEVMEMSYNSIEDPASFIQRLISILNTQPSTSVFAKFTYDIHWYSDNPAAHVDDTRPMLRAKGKSAGFLDRHYYPTWDTTYAVADFLDAGFKENTRIFSKVDAHVRLPFITVATDDLIVRIGGIEYQTSAYTVNGLSDLTSGIRSILTANSITGITVNEGNFTVSVFADKDIQIIHESCGSNIDIYRGVDSTDIMRMPYGFDVRLGEPVFAFIDETYRFDAANITWTLTDALTDEIITTQHAWAFRWVMSAEGSYSLQLSIEDQNGIQTSTKQGCYLVRRID